MGSRGISLLNDFTDQQMKELLRLASDDPRTGREWLLEVGEVGRVELLLEQVCSGKEHTGGTLLAAVLSQATSVSALMAAKNAAKELTVLASTPAHKAAALMLYHLAVAAALVRHGKCISAKMDEERLFLYQELAAGLTDEILAGVFEAAVSKLKKS